MVHWILTLKTIKTLFELWRIFAKSAYEKFGHKNSLQRQWSSSDLTTVLAEEKTQKRSAESSRKQLLTGAIYTAAAAYPETVEIQVQKLTAKYSRLVRTLTSNVFVSLAASWYHFSYQQLWSRCEHALAYEEPDHTVAAHTAGDDGLEFLLIQNSHTG